MMRRWRFWRRGGVEPRDLSNGGRTFMMDAEWVRSEELRPDRLGPGPDDVVNPERVKVERWRPKRTLD